MRMRSLKTDPSHGQKTKNRELPHLAHKTNLRFAAPSPKKTLCSGE